MSKSGVCGPKLLAAALAAMLLATACEQQAPVSAAPPEAITAPAPAANPQPDINAEPVERAAPPMLKPVALGEFDPGNPVAIAVTGKLSIEDSVLRGENGASFTTERAAIVNATEQYMAGSTYADSMMIPPDQKVELRRVLEQTPPTQAPADALCGGDRAGFIALASVTEGGTEVVKLMGLKGSDLPAATAHGVALCAITHYIAAKPDATAKK